MIRLCRLYSLYLCLAAVVLAASDPCDAAGFRNLFGYTYIDYEGIGTSHVLENTLISQVRPGLSLLTRLYHDRRSDWNNSIVTIGPVINIGRYHYIEVTYGYGRDSDKRRADYLGLELTRETPKYLAAVGFKHSAYPGYDYYTLSPSVKYYITPRIALWGKYFASIDSDDNFDHAYWTDVEVGITARTAVRCGVTGGNRLYSPEYESVFGGKADMRFFSVLAQLSYRITERFMVKYVFEDLTRQSKYTDIKNTFVIDARF